MNNHEFPLTMHLKDFHFKFKESEDILKYAISILSNSDPLFTGGAWVFGETGSGKSHIANILQEKYPPHETETSRIIPALVITTPTTNSSELDIYEEILRTVNYPRDRNLKTRDALHHCIKAFKDLQVMIFIIDEFHQIFGKRPNKRAFNTLSGIKRLLSETGVPGVFLNSTNHLENREINSELTDRTPAIFQLPSLQDDNAIARGVTAYFEEINQYKLNGILYSTKINKNSLKFKKGTKTACGGTFRGLKNIILTAVKHMEKEKKHELNISHFTSAYSELFGPKETPYK